MNKFGDNFKKLRTSRHLTQEEIADQFNMTKTGISYWENGKTEPSLKMIKEIADYFNVSMSTLMGESKGSNLITSIQIPLYSPICCGNGGFCDDNIIDYVSLPSTWLNPRAEYFAQVAKGDSMKGAGIKDGDILVFEKTGHCESGQIGCFCIDDNDAMCKKYRVTDNNQIVLMPANDKYDPIVVDIENEHFRCIGVLAYSVHSFK
ncbi:MAG: helix-turn-helix domain-containing protein [Solobacterium sp.]|jgi:repressor LexA|nr:helix-turn-helix domain-containing protein [Solobacterium sp.]MCH4281552.1 helix-turn-helix domain-containing protein [Solobacterium sp.]